MNNEIFNGIAIAVSILCIVGATVGTVLFFVPSYRRKFDQALMLGRVASETILKDFSRFPCGHGISKSDLTLTIFGRTITLRPRALPLCQECATRFLEAYSGRCASCGLAIFPGELVGRAADGEGRPYVHLTRDCVEGGFYCGKWGQGSLITPEKLEERPAPWW